MKPLSPNPILYEINTVIWLDELTHEYRRPVRLGNVPDEEWERLARMGVELVWLMGVWQRSPFARQLVSQNPVAIKEFKQVLPDFKLQDLIGSAYSVQNYLVDPAIGGDAGLAEERKKLAAFGMRLILDYVPNHVAPDHPWTVSHPEYFIQGDAQDLLNDQESFIQIGRYVLARGRDPNFPAWMDVVQLNAFHPGMRQATQETIRSIASRCDGMRVDMAMLLINRIFASTWNSAAGESPDEEYWPMILEAVKQQYPGTLFIAEAYWETEKELIDSGFNYCYDKALYDCLKDNSAREIFSHIQNVQSYQNQLVRFVENHDEQRAKTAFPGDEWELAALAAATLPGLRMFHDGQFEGRRARISVLLGRRPTEVKDEDTFRFYQRLLNASSQTPIRDGEWAFQPIFTEGGHIPAACLSWIWKNGVDSRIILMNFSHKQTSVRLRLDEESRHHSAKLLDIWNGEVFIPSQDSDRSNEFHVSLPPRHGRVLEVS